MKHISKTNHNSSKTKHRTMKKHSFSKRLNKSKKNQTKRIFLFNNKRTNCNKRYTKKKMHRGGDVAEYPPVYGIDNKAVLYPISKYGIPGGPFDPPALSNGPNGNGPYPGVRYGGNKRTSKYKQSKIRRSKFHNGGGRQSTFLPQPLVNTTRSITSDLTEIVNGFSGRTNSASLNPMPYNQPIEQDIKYIHTDFPNIANDYKEADNYVSTHF